MVFGGVLVMVSLHGGATHISDDVEAGNGIGVIADYITEADEIGNTLARGVGKNGFESLKVGMYVTE
jgi:hypothetical protein